jgi:hypothetical protein
MPTDGRPAGRTDGTRDFNRRPAVMRMFQRTINLKLATSTHLTIVRISCTEAIREGSEIVRLRVTKAMNCCLNVSCVSGYERASGVCFDLFCE